MFGRLISKSSKREKVRQFSTTTNPKNINGVVASWWLGVTVQTNDTAIRLLRPDTPCSMDIASLFFNSTLVYFTCILIDDSLRVNYKGEFD